MTKAKVVLTAIGIIAIAGGALAFKATRFSAMNVYCKDDLGDCYLTNYQTLTVAGFSTTWPCGTKTRVYYLNDCIVAHVAFVYATDNE